MDPLKRPAATLGLKPPKHRTYPTIASYANLIKDPTYLHTLQVWEEESNMPPLKRGTHHTAARAIRYTLLTSRNETITYKMGRNILHPEIWVALAGLK